ncbi:MAG: hypothetical protein AB7Q29_09515 [Vicinamibacterales bacterium]
MTRLAVPLVLLLICSSPLHAQQPAARPELGGPLVNDYSQQLLQDLPSGDNLFSVLEVLQPTLITDRFTGGGLSVGQPARVGGFLPSWTQTLFQIDGVNVTDPTGIGAPLFLPDLAFIGRMRVRTGMMSGGEPWSGLSVDLAPVASGNAWGGLFEAGTARGALTTDGPATGAPTLARTTTWDRSSFVASGPLAAGRGGAVLGISGATASRVDRREPAATGRQVSGFGSLRLDLTSEDQLRAIGWIQRRDAPLDQRAVLRLPDAGTTFTSLHTQAVWERRSAARSIRAHTSFSQRSGTVDTGALAQNGIMERLVDGPPQAFSLLSNQTVRLWSAGATYAPRLVVGDRTHDVYASADILRASVRTPQSFQGVVGELVDGVPARVWSFAPAGVESSRASTTFGATVGDRVAIGPRVSVDASLRIESLSGSARGAADGISWTNLLPHAAARLALTEDGRLSAFGAYSRYGDRLLLDYLAIGDPAASTATARDWQTAPDALSLTSLGAIVSRWGPGTGGDPSFTTIDPSLRRPTTDEFLVGIEARPREHMLLRFTGVARRQNNLLGLVNTGVTAAAYDTFEVTDPGGKALDASDDKVLTIYDRRPSSFGLDRYRLTNPGQDAAFKGFEITLGYTSDRFTLLGGGTAGMAEGSGASRGFGPLENDQTILGELFANPNAATLARGRLFTDRAYTGKLAAIVALPSDVRVGLIARYQDGQPFSRVRVFTDLRQGAEAIRGFASGDSRFMFIGTLDVRVQKRVALRRGSVAVFLDGYNVLNMSNSVEEDVARAVDVRIPTAIQPPRTLQVGIRLGF